MKQYDSRRIFMLSFSILLMGLGIALLFHAEFGTDPFSCLIFGLSELIQLPFWVIHIAVGVIFFAVTYVFAAHLARIGMVVHFIFVGIFVSLFDMILQKAFGSISSLPIRAVFFVSGLILFALASSLYFTSGFGITSYDAIGFILSGKFSFPHRWCRILLDLFCTAVGLSCGASIGIASVITIFFLGPLVKLFNRYVSIPLLEQDPD